jgi:hypothetical protein
MTSPFQQAISKPSQPDHSTGKTTLAAVSSKKSRSASTLPLGASGHF